MNTIRLDEIQAIPDMTITDSGTNGAHWQRLNLADPQYAIQPEPPEIHGLLYRGKRHVISGPPESSKTLIAYQLLLEALRSGNPIAIIDFEMGPTAARRLMEDVGYTIEEIQAVYYVEPDRPPTDLDIQELITHQAAYVLIDAAAGAYDATGLDDNARKDVEHFARRWIRPLRQHTIATILIDHVTKNADTRGKYAIGSERKVGQAEVHLSLDALKPLSRGGHGLVKISVHKDRPGFLPRPTATIAQLESHPDTHRIDITFREPEHIEPGDDWKPTILMERVSVYLEQQTEPVSRTQIETNVKGKSAKHIRQSIDVLINDGFAAEIPGARGARNVTLIRRYRQPETVTNYPTSDPVYPMVEPNHDVTNPETTDLTPSDPVPPRPDGVTTTPSDGVPPSGAPTGSTTPRRAHPVQSSDGVDDQEIDRLLGLYGPTQ